MTEIQLRSLRRQANVQDLRTLLTPISRQKILKVAIHLLNFLLRRRQQIQKSCRFPISQIVQQHHIQIESHQRILKIRIR